MYFNSSRFQCHETNSRTSCINRTPRTVPVIRPRPPKMLVPPRTTAVIASSSMPVAMSTLAVSRRATNSTAAVDATRPDSVYSASLIRPTATPENHATRSLCPMTYSSRPTAVRHKTTAATTPSTRKITPGVGMPPSVPWPSTVKHSGKPDTGDEPPSRPSATPR